LESNWTNQVLDFGLQNFPGTNWCQLAAPGYMWQEPAFYPGTAVIWEQTPTFTYNPVGFLGFNSRQAWLIWGEGLAGPRF